MNFLPVLVLALTSTVATAQVVDAVATTPTDFLLKSAPLLLGVMALCRGLSEILLWAAAKTKSDGVGKLGRVLGQVADVLARVLAYFGVGMPKPLLMARAEKIALKEMTVEEAAAPVDGRP